MKTKMTKTKRKKRAATPVKPGAKVVKTTRKMRAAPPAEPGTEVHLEQLRKSTLKTYEAHRNVDENDLPPEKRPEYSRNRYLAGTAWELAENAAFADLVEEQKRKLPEVATSNAKLASDVEATADALAMVNLVSTSLSVLAEVITLLSRVVPK